MALNASLVALWLPAPVASFSAASTPVVTLSVACAIVVVSFVRRSVSGCGSGSLAPAGNFSPTPVPSKFKSVSAVAVGVGVGVGVGESVGGVGGVIRGGATEVNKKSSRISQFLPRYPCRHWQR